MKEEFEIRQLDKETIKDQLLIYRTAFKTTEMFENNINRWRKKHYENPLGDSIIFGAYYNGVLVGMNAYMPVEYFYNGDTIPMLQSCESAVAPDFQGKGIWSKIVRYAIDYIFQNTKYQAVIGFPNYINSYPGFKKMGWDTLFGMNNYVMVNNAKEFAKGLFKSKKLLQLLGRCIFIQKTGIWFYGRGYQRFKIEECGFDNLFWDDDRDVLSVTHSYELLKWKESYKGIKTLSIKSGNNPIASCIYSFGEYEGSQIIKIEKCVLPEGSSISLKKAVALLAKYFAQNYPQIAFIRAWAMPETKFASTLKGLLFLKSSHPNPFIIKQNSKVFFDKRWNLSFFDLD